MGVDIERVRPVSVRAMERIAGVRTEAAFFRSWVRREARVKRTGSGIVTMMRTEAPLNRGSSITRWMPFMATRRVLLPDSRSRRSRCTV